MELPLKIKDNLLSNLPQVQYWNRLFINYLFTSNLTCFVPIYTWFYSFYISDRNPKLCQDHEKREEKGNMFTWNFTAVGVSCVLTLQLVETTRETNNHPYKLTCFSPILNRCSYWNYRFTLNSKRFFRICRCCGTFYISELWPNPKLVRIEKEKKPTCFQLKFYTGCLYSQFSQSCCPIIYRRQHEHDSFFRCNELKH